MAVVPISGSDIRLMSSVPFQSDYKHTRWFDTKTEQTNYFLAKPLIHQMSQSTFQRKEGAYLRINKSVDQLRDVNYCMFRNTEYNNKWFYAFVTNLEYVNRGLTHVYIEIDVFQTWKFDMDFKPSFVVREHQQEYNANGHPLINTLEEGLDYGSEYETVYMERYKPYDDLFFLVIVSKSAMHTTDNEITPTVNGAPQPLSYYVHPFRLDGSVPDVNIDGTSWGLTGSLETLKAMFVQDNAVNNVVSIYVTDFPPFNAGYDGTTLSVVGTMFEGAIISDNQNYTGQTLYLKKLEDYQFISKNMGDKYSGFKSVDSSKLLMYPYAVTYLDDFKGNRQVIKNEYINDTDLVLLSRSSLGTSNKISYGIYNYLTDSSLSLNETTDMSLEHSLINNNPNDLPILSDYLSAYLQGNRNSLENQKNSIQFNGWMDAIGGTIGAGAGIAERSPEAIGSSVTGIAKGAGNTVLQLQALEAKKQDISNTPPSLSKMGSNTAFDYGNDYHGVYIIKKQIQSGYRDKLADFFNMFGWKKHMVKIPNFKTRQYWNYVQTESCVIQGNFNNEDINELKSVFDGGITFWHDDDIGNYERNNVDR